jgi:hypothetical protein
MKYINKEGKKEKNEERKEERKVESKTAGSALDLSKEVHLVFQCNAFT